VFRRDLGACLLPREQAQHVLEAVAELAGRRHRRHFQHLDVDQWLQEIRREPAVVVQHRAREPTRQ
jgi:hypothetical protein